MEDAATAEISRAQLWQWLRHGSRLDDGRIITRAFCRQLFEEELNKLLAATALPQQLELKQAARGFARPGLSKTLYRIPHIASLRSIAG
jgi:malate synthase